MRLNHILAMLIFFLSVRTRSQVSAAFLAPDTVCVNQTFTVTNTSTGATTQYWSFCQGNYNVAPLAINMGNLASFSGPVFNTIAKDGSNYYAFIDNNFPGSLSRLSFGSSLLNPPVGANLGNLGVLPNNLEDIHIEYQAGNWYGIAVGGMSGAEKIVRLNFGASLANIPTATNLGNIGGLSYPQRIKIFNAAGTYYGFVCNNTNNTITRLNFGASIANVPTGLNLGNIGTLNAPDAIALINVAGLWYGYVINEGSNTITRLDFGNSLLNIPIGTNLGNTGALNGPRAIDVWVECNQIKGLITNRFGNDLLKMNFTAGPTGPIVTTSFGNIASFSFPHSIGRFRSGDTLYAFITNVSNNTMSRICYPGCTNASIPSTTVVTPPPLSYNAPGNYYINILVNEGQITQASYCKQITVLGTSVTASNSGPVCAGGSVTLTATGSTNYTWSPGALTGSSIVVNPTSSMIYSVSIGGGSSCASMATTSVSVGPGVSLNASASASVVCAGNPVTLSTSGANSYTWNPGNLIGASVVVSPSANMVYTVTGSTGSCLGTGTVAVNVNASPSVSINSSLNGCIGSTINLFAIGNPNYNYQWSGANGFSSNLQNVSFVATSGAFGGIYSVTVSNNGCNSVASTNIGVTTFTPVQILSNGSQGCAPYCADLSVPIPTSIPVNWTFGDGGQSTGSSVRYCFNNVGTYSVGVVVTNSLGCNSIGSLNVTVYPKPVADFNYSPYLPIVDQDHVTFTDASYPSPISSWNWYFTNTSQFTSNVQNPTFSFPEAGQYVIALVVKSDKGCLDTALKSIVVGEDFGIWVPNSFTPNGDGLNDLFFAKGFGITNFAMEIFDRWGEKVFTSKDINEAWDGSVQNKKAAICKEETYTWIINVSNVFGKAKEFTGHITLIK